MLVELKTSRGTVFKVLAETEHFLLCGAPKNNDTARDALLDFEDLYLQGFRFCSNVPGDSGVVFFEKKVHA